MGNPPVRVLPFSLENLRAVLPAPKMAAEDCPVCKAIGGPVSKLIKGWRCLLHLCPLCQEVANLGAREALQG